MPKIKKAGYWKVRRNVETLERLVTTNAAASIHAPILNSAMTGVIMSGQTIKNEYLYRSRWNVAGRLFANVSELSYRPEAFVNTKGRLNDIGESILYAAACELGTIIEARPQFGKLLTIAKIKILNSEVLYFPIGMLDMQPNYEQASRAEKLVIDYCNREITKTVVDPEQYNSTIALGNHFLKTNIVGRGKRENAAAIYPSVEGSKICNKRTYNVAMLPKVFDENFAIIEATTYILTNEGTHLQLNGVNITESINQNRDLDWKYDYNEMTQRIEQGATLEDNFCENVSKIEIDRVVNE